MKHMGASRLEVDSLAIFFWKRRVCAASDCSNSGNQCAQPIQIATEMQGQLGYLFNTLVEAKQHNLTRYKECRIKLLISSCFRNCSHPATPPAPPGCFKVRIVSGMFGVDLATPYALAMGFVGWVRELGLFRSGRRAHFPVINSTGLSGVCLGRL